MSFTFLENADQGKHGLALRNLNSQKSLGIDQFLKTLTKATNVLSNHKFENNRQTIMQPNNNNWNRNNEQVYDSSPILSFSQIEGKFCYCGKRGHKSLECCVKNRILCE